MVRPGAYPAAVTPFDERGRLDWAGVAKLLAWFEASGCTGAVLAGTNGEGPSLSAVEKRELIERAMPLRGKLDLILGIATPSLEEAAWLCRRAHDAGAVAVLVMAPFYFREAGEAGIEAWFSELLDRSPLPVIAYNFPKRAGMPLSPELICRLGSRETMIGVKDSSGERGNIAAYRQALERPEQVLFVGDETLLWEALEAGWSGTISGAANSLALPIAAIVSDFFSGQRESAQAKFHLTMPLIEAVRSNPQPATNKALLHRWGVLPSPAVRLPLTAADPDVVGKLAALLLEKGGLGG